MNVVSAFRLLNYPDGILVTLYMVIRVRSSEILQKGPYFRLLPKVRFTLMCCGLATEWSYAWFLCILHAFLATHVACFVLDLHVACFGFGGMIYGS